MPSYDEWKKESSIWPRIGLMVLIVLTIGSLSLLGSLVYIISGGVRSTPTRNINAEQVEAASFCKRQVRASLKAPQTAKFPMLDFKATTSADEQTFYVTSYVDSQNGFGAMLRTNYQCELQYQGGDYDGWKLMDLSTW